MKGYITLSIALCLLFAACKKGSDVAPSGGNGGSGGTGGNPIPPPAKGSIIISGVSPQRPHPDNIITITGTGFNADATKDIVYFGNYDTTKKTFRAYADGGTQDYKSTILSASATQLSFKTLDSLLLDLDVMDAPKFRMVPAIQVIANGDTTVQVVNFQEMVRLGNLYDPLMLRQAIATGWPNDSLYIDMLGPVDKTASLTIGGKACDFTPQDVPANTEHETLLHTFLPKSLAIGNNDTSMAPQVVKLTLADGTVEQATYKFYQSPHMVVTKMAAELGSYSQGGLTSSGGVININITGRNLKNDATYVVVKSGVPGIIATGSLDVSNFPDNATIVLPALAPYTYIVTLTRKDITNGQNISYGQCQVNVGP